LAASGQNIHRQALSAKAKSATGSSGCGSFASGSLVSIFSARRGRSMNASVEARWKIAPSHYFI
jgi:hypothetical protein